MIRTLLAAALLAASTVVAAAQSTGAAPAIPALRANVSVSADIVRIGDVIDNAGDAGSIAIYRAPDLGTTGTLPATQVIAALRAHQVIGVDTRNLTDISVTRLSRAIEPKDIEAGVAEALQRRNGLGDARDLELTFDRGLQTLQLDAANTGALRPVSIRLDPRNNRFDVTFEIANGGDTPTRLRFTGAVVDTVEAAVLTRSIDRNELIKASDIIVERRPRVEVGRDGATRDQTVGMQARRQLRASQALRISDVARPDLVQRDQAVTIIFQTSGIYLTIRGKALESGTEGDVVNVVNLQSKRTFPATVIGRGQVSIANPHPVVAAAAPAPVAVAANDHAQDRLSVSRKAE